MNFQRDDTTVAQSVAHLPCMQKVGASNPLEDIYIYLIAGLIAYHGVVNASSLSLHCITSSELLLDLKVKSIDENILE